MTSARFGSSDEPPMFCVGVGILPDAVAVFGNTAHASDETVLRR